MDLCGCACMHGCTWVCLGVSRYTWVCMDVSGFAWVYMGVRAWVCVRGCACMGVCAWVCLGVSRYTWVWDEFSEYLLQTRVLTSADIHILYKFFYNDFSNIIDKVTIFGKLDFRDGDFWHFRDIFGGKIHRGCWLLNLLSLEKLIIVDEKRAYQFFCLLFSK